MKFDFTNNCKNQFLLAIPFYSKRVGSCTRVLYGNWNEDPAEKGSRVGRWEYEARRGEGREQGARNK